jgi:hypothetical protein
MFQILQKRRELALVRQEVEAVLLAAQPDEALTTAEIVRRGWGHRPEDRCNHYDLYYDVKRVLGRMHDIGLVDVRQAAGQSKRWLASEEARALQVHQQYQDNLAA